MIEERGVNCLFMAVGFLEWKEAEGAERSVRAPLLLVPVAVERTSARSRFRISATDDDPILNPCIVRKLQDFRVRLSDPPDDWTDFDPEAYLASVREAVSGQSEWRVLPDIYLGLFSFAKYLMYVDLDPERWPQERSLLAGSLIRGLCGDPEALKEDLSDVPGPGELDERGRPEETFQVLDADSSQQEAICAARAGKSLVVQGPPGTGKSQTIANIIAECLARREDGSFRE